MKNYNQKHVSLPGIQIAETKGYLMTDYGNTRHINFYRKIIDLAIRFEKSKIKRKEIIGVKINAEKDSYNDIIKNFHFEIKTQNKDGNQNYHQLYVPVDRVIGISNNFEEERNYHLRWGGLLTFMTALSFQLDKHSFFGIVPLIVSALNIHLFALGIKFAIQYKKTENILLAITALEKGLLAAENAQKAFEKKSSKKSVTLSFK